jgi:hypothetical protein
VFWGGAAGLLTALASGLLFSAHTLVQLYGTIHWSDIVNVLYFHSYNGNHYSVALANAGSGAVLVSEITIFPGSGENKVLYVGHTINPGDIWTSYVADPDSEYVEFPAYAKKSLC